MARVTLGQVQQWLERTKLELQEYDEELEASAVEFVFARVATRYDTTAWTSTSNTPSLIQKILALYIAAWTYARQYSEDEDQVNEYVEKLEKMADGLLEGIANGTLIVTGAVDIVGPSPAASFYPTDAQDDEEGGHLGADESRKFTMGKVF